MQIARYFRNLRKRVINRLDPVVRAKQSARRKALKAHPIAQKCEVGGCEKIGRRHHDDYNKPTEIRWFCGEHHIAHELEHQPIQPIVKKSNRAKVNEMCDADVLLLGHSLGVA